MAFDLTIRQGDLYPPLTASLTDASGNALNLTGASVTFVMRLLTATTPAVNATATITNATTGAVQYSWASGDTATAGIYTAEFHVTGGAGGTVPSGQTYTWPSDGYLEISVEPNLTAAGTATIVSLGQVKDYLNIPATSRNHDAKLADLIQAATPIVENITGPIVVREYDEGYDGGSWFVRLRHRPLVSLLGVSEYRGPIEWPLVIVQDPAHGQVFSAMADPDGTRIVRRGPGGSVMAFPAMPQSVHVVYTAGQSVVPANVREGTLELIRVNYQMAQESGRPGFGGGRGEDDLEPRGVPVGFFVPARVREMLSPNRRAPSVV